MPTPFAEASAAKIIDIVDDYVSFSPGATYNAMMLKLQTLVDDLILEFASKKLSADQVYAKRLSDFKQHMAAKLDEVVE